MLHRVCLLLYVSSLYAYWGFKSTSSIFKLCLSFFSKKKHYCCHITLMTNDNRMSAQTWRVSPCPGPHSWLSYQLTAVDPQDQMCRASGFWSETLQSAHKQTAGLHAIPRWRTETLKHYDQSLRHGLFIVTLIFHCDARIKTRPFYRWKKEVICVLQNFGELPMNFITCNVNVCRTYRWA